MVMSNSKCEWCEDGVCVYFRTLLEQYFDEQDGLPTDWCDGSIEMQIECGMKEE